MIIILIFESAFYKGVINFFIQKYYQKTYFFTATILIFILNLIIRHPTHILHKCIIQFCQDLQRPWPATSV